MSPAETLWCVQACEPAWESAARQLAESLSLPFDGPAHFALQVGDSGLRLQELGAGAPGPVQVDFVGGAMAHRRRQGGGNGQMIAKAIGIQPGIRPDVLDATAGLGRDAFVLAQLGCQVSLIERQPVMAALLADGLRRAHADAEVAPIVERMQLIQGDAIALMRAWVGTPPQVIYLDPMFPHRDKSSLVKKEMLLLRPLVGDDQDAPALLEAALALATHRVVVKRPRKAPTVDARQPGYTLEGKSSRFDIYPLRSFKPKGGAAAD
ncbi:MAG: class I SAM-dependent methyltransferase [Azonexus sp.]|nr:class I SAM-dependent methyltransferase [Azonexus sp.]